ncbi:MAG: PIN domain-containing protein [Fimbriimonadales bacterium]|nr:PIN domain-containing protein [Fimbriimonadales bacterium]
MPSDSNLAIVDSNIFVYAHDTLEPEKRAIAKQLVRELSEAERLVVTVQIVHEFCAVMLRKQRAGVASFESLRELAEEMMAAATQVFALTPAVTLRALYGCERYQLSFWDALIWAAAREYGVSTIYSEDFHPGTLEGVAFINPFGGEGARG